MVQALYVTASDASEGGATLRTRVYDDLGTLPWPADVDGRALRNRFGAMFPDGVPEAVRPAGPCLHAARTLGLAQPAALRKVLLCVRCSLCKVNLHVDTEQCTKHARDAQTRR